MESPAKVTIGAKHTQNTTESTSPPTQVTIQAQNSTDTKIKTNYEEGNGG